MMDLDIRGTQRGEIRIVHLPVSDLPDDLYVILRDWEVAPWRPRDTVMHLDTGEPASQKTLDDRFIETTKAFQFLHRDLIRALAPPTMPEKQVNNIFARINGTAVMICNRHGSEVKADYVNNKNLTIIKDGAEIPNEPISQETLLDRGNVVHVIGDPIWAAGESWRAVETLTVDNLPTIAELLPQVWLWQKMSTVTPERLSDGTYRANPFPDFMRWMDENDCYDARHVDVPFIPLSRAGISHVPEAQLRKLAVGEPIPSVYNPMWS
jgi:hypothetical protein